MHLQENNFFPYSYDIYVLNLFEIVFFLYIYIVSYCKVVALSLVLLIHVFIFVSDFFFSFAELSGGQIVEDVLTSGLSAKLMRYLRIRVLGEASASQKDASYLIEGKNASSATCIRGREEGRCRVRQLPEATLENNIRAADERSLADLDERSLESVGEDNDDIDADGGERRHGRDLRDVKTKFAELDESGRDDLLRRRPSRGWTRHRGRGRVNETALENEQVSTSPDSGSRSGPGRSARDRNSKNLLDVKKGPDTRKFQGNMHSDGLAVERDDNDDCFQGCRIGTKDISDLVKKAVQAAEAEARGANAPAGAIKAAGDAAAEDVKSAALEVSKLSYLFYSLFYWLHVKFETFIT